MTCVCFQMHLPLIRRCYQISSRNLIRTYRYQTKVFGYNAQLQSNGNLEEMEKILRKYRLDREEEGDCISCL